MQATTSNRRRVVTLATAIFATFIIGVAFAAWTANGSGTGEATAGQSIDLDIEPVSAGTLFPNTTNNLTVQINNPNPFNVALRTIDEGTSAITSNNPACDASTVSFKDGGYQYSGDAIVVGKDHDRNVVLTDALTMNNGDDDCKNATFTVNLVLTGESTAADAN